MNGRGAMKWRRLWLLLFPASVLVAVLSVLGLPGEGSPSHADEAGMVLTSSSCNGPSFCITSPSPGPVLYPGGAPSNLPLTFSNPLNVPLRVYSFTVSFTNQFPAGCAASALQINGTGASGTTPSVTINFSSPDFAVPAATGAGNGTAVYPATLALADNHTKQDACQKLGLTMAYSASAYYTVTTHTLLAPSPSPATVGQPVTLQATVAPTVTPSSAGSTPVGTVTFYQCTISTGGCSSQIGSPVPVSSGVATTTTTFNVQGTYYLEAVYTPTDSTNFAPSTSNIATEAANYTSCITSSSSGNLTVGSGQTDCITTTGKVTGSVTVNSGGRLDVLGGIVSGNVTTNSGSGLKITGGSIGGNISSTGSTYMDVCGLNLGGNLSISSASTFVQAGDSDSTSNPKCSGNTISGAITLAGNTAGADVGSNSTNGGLTVTNTVGPLEIEANKIGGGLSCSGNNPSPTDDAQANTVSGKRSGQCAAAGF